MYVLTLTSIQRITEADFEMALGEALDEMPQTLLRGNVIHLERA